MSYTKTFTAFLVAAFTSIAAPSFALTQGDVAACRAAVSAQTPGLLEGYRLRFKKEIGVGNRLIKFEAIPNMASAGKGFNLTCEFNRVNTVLAFHSDKTVQYATKD